MAVLNVITMLLAYFLSSLIGNSLSKLYLIILSRTFCVPVVAFVGWYFVFIAYPDSFQTRIGDCIAFSFFGTLMGIFFNYKKFNSRIRHLDAVLKDGTITQEEYELKKKEIIESEKKK